MPHLHSIPLAEAAAMTRRYRENRETILAENYRDRDILAVCETFEAEAILRVLGQEGCVGLRIYFGMDESLKLHAILVGTDDMDRDIIPPEADATEGTILEDAKRCPTMCPPESPLNGG